MSDLAKLASVISQRSGRDVSVYEPSFLAKSLAKRIAATALPTTAKYLAFLAENKAETDIFLRSLNVPYSEFFRSPLAFALLENLVLPRWVEEKQKSGAVEMRVWSAGCAAGQEAYSIAILLSELAAANGQRFSFRIFATDLSEPELAAAQAGVYEPTALQNVRLKHLRTYFRPHGEGYQVQTSLQEKISFTVYDLLDEHSASPPDSIYGDFDLILCSNVLIYYRPDICQLMLTRLHQCLSPDGCLLTGDTERSLVQKSGLFRVISPPAPVFQKMRRA